MKIYILFCFSFMFFCNRQSCFIHPHAWLIIRIRNKIRSDVLGWQCEYVVCAHNSSSSISFLSKCNGSVCACMHFGLRMHFHCFTIEKKAQSAHEMKNDVNVFIMKCHYVKAKTINLNHSYWNQSVVLFQQFYKN